MALDEKYDFRAIEQKWQARWRDANLYRVEADPAKPKYYGLEFFPYPSGSGLSVGHFKNYAPTDAFLRYKAMQGFNVLHPMGWDAFGLPAENEAIKRQRQPRTMVREYADTYKRQFNLIGMGYDWDREINSSGSSCSFTSAASPTGRTLPLTGVRSTKRRSPMRKSSTATASAAARRSRRR